MKCKDCKNYKPKLKFKEGNDLKGEDGFVVMWLFLLIYSIVMVIFNWKVAILGFILLFALGFLGFDTVEAIKKRLKK